MHLTSSASRPALGGVVLALVLLAASWLAYSDAPGSPGASPRATALKPPATREPLVPTPLPAFRATATPRADANAAAPGWIALTAPIRGARARVGVGVPVGPIDAYDWGDAWPGWYVLWRVEPDPPAIPSTQLAQLVYTKGDKIFQDMAVLRRTAQAHPGMLWMIGNEPDVPWQGNATPEQYARTYHDLYEAIKEADPTARLAIGGVSQPTPLRLAYLDAIRAAYRAQFSAEMPVDVWNVHAFILREERDSWGVGIPPGMPVNQGALYEISDHADMALFRRQIVDFRRWMAERGLRDKPLIVSEYGILMPESYGFPVEVVAGFMVDSFDFFLTAGDPETGYPADDNRLVQAFCWYSVSDTTYPTPNLFAPETRRITPVGEVFRAYVSALPD